MDPAHNLHDIFKTELNSKVKKIENNFYIRESDINKLSKEYLKITAKTIERIISLSTSLILIDIFLY